MAEYFKSKYFESLPPISGSQDGMLKLSEDYDIHIVTSRQYELEQQTRHWLFLHFPDLITEVHFGNAHGVGAQRSKKEILSTIKNVVAIIDDIPSTCISCAGLQGNPGFLSILFDYQGSYKWSKPKAKLPSGVVCVQSWNDIVALLTTTKLLPKLE